MTSPVTHPTVHEASTHLYEALSHHFGPIDMSATDPIVRAVAEFGQRCREHDQAGEAAASAHLYEALSRHFGPHDASANDPLVVALSEFAQACREAGTIGR